MKPLLIAGALTAFVAVGCSGGGDDAGPPPTDAPTTTTTVVETTTSVTTTTTTTTVAPEPEPDGEGFDIDREFSQDSEAESLGPIGTTETTIPTEEGEISIGGGEVPDLGDEFPLPEGFEVQVTTEIEGEVGFSGRVDGSLADLIAFYDEALPAAGYDVVERQEVPDTFAVLSVEGPLVGDVVISQEVGGEGWTVLIGLVEP